MTFYKTKDFSLEEWKTLYKLLKGLYKLYALKGFHKLHAVKDYLKLMQKNICFV